MLLAALAVYILSSVKDRDKAVPVEEFGGHVQRMHADRDKWFELEYEVRAKNSHSPQFLWCLFSCLCRLVCVSIAVFGVDLTEYNQLLPKAMLLLLLCFLMLLLLRLVTYCPPTWCFWCCKACPQHQHEQTRETGVWLFCSSLLPCKHWFRGLFHCIRISTGLHRQSTKWLLSLKTELATVLETSSHVRDNMYTNTHTKLTQHWLYKRAHTMFLCLADDFNRVELKNLPGEEHTDYINASLIDVWTT